MFHNYIKLYEEKNIRVINHLVGYGVGWAFIKKTALKSKHSPKTPSRIRAKDIRNKLKQYKLNTDIGTKSVLSENLSQMINTKIIEK